MGCFVDRLQYSSIIHEDYLETHVKIDRAALEQAQQHYADTLNEDNRQVRDPVITPFAMAMRLSGFTVVSHPGGCDILRECPGCRSRYSTKYTKASVVYWACPHCQKITEE